MKGKAFQKIVSVTAALLLLSSLAACGTNEAQQSANTQPDQTVEQSTPAETTAPTVSAGPVTVKFFSNLPDRTANQGKLEQDLIDNYLKENPNVKIELEALQDEPYKQKIKTYTASNNMPDFYMVWGQTSFFAPMMKAGFAAELNKADYDSYGFFPGSTDGFSMDGKLYGLPRNTDFMVLYYNKGLFDSNGIKVPTTFSELVAAAKAFRAKGIAPIAMNGKDKWTIAIMYQDLVAKYNGDQKEIYKALNRENTFAQDESLLKGAQLMKELMDAKAFQDSFTAADYGAANNLFAQEKAAMYYMGSWEMGMAANEQFPESFRKNLGVVKFPAVDGGKGKDTDLAAWNGGGYAVSANSQVKAEAIKLLNYFFKPDNWAKNAWQMGVCVPAQNYDAYLTGNETNLQKDLTAILSASTSLSGVTWNDSATPQFKTDCENLSQELAAGLKTPEEFLKECDKAADTAAGK
jgi:raffinose/stachyose/melibiose transport system substrate-binding protein